MTITLGVKGTNRILSAYGADFALPQAQAVCALVTEWEKADARTAYLATSMDALDRGEVTLALKKGAPFAIGRCIKGRGDMPFALPEELKRASELEQGGALWLFAKKGCTSYVQKLLGHRFEYFLCLPDGCGGMITVLFAVKNGEKQAVLVNETEGKGTNDDLCRRADKNTTLLLAMGDYALNTPCKSAYVGRGKEADLRICKVVKGERGTAFDLVMNGECMESIALPGKSSAVTSHGAFAYAAGRFCGMGDYEIRREFMKMVV
ncbi:MAG: hypothetical protein IJY89_06115 [Clostridia bacterium]|nr:hypothetical protein [Clostridia bacterium]